MHRNLRALACLVVIVAAAGSARAGMITFIPPNDTSGKIFTKNANDGYNPGRGIVFSMQGDALIDSVGLFHDLSGVNLAFEIAEVLTTVGQVTFSQTVLRSGSSTVSTNGLQWIDFSIAPLLLESGKNYHIEFTHFASGNQNFFYQNFNIPFSQGDFKLIDGTFTGSTTNTILPAIRVNEVSASPVPEPASIALLGIGAVGIIGAARRRRRETQPA